MDVEKARGLMDAIISANRLSEAPNGAVDAYAQRALRAIDGECGEERWVADEWGGDWAVWHLDGGYRGLIAKGLTKPTARRIARIPALERLEASARKVHDRYYHGEPSTVTRHLDEAFRELDAALNQEGQ